MGDIGLDNWYRKMEEHRRDGRPLIVYPRYPEPDDKTTVADATQEDILSKDQRIAFWEKHRRIPGTDELLWWEREVET